MVDQLLLQHVDCCISVLFVDVGFWGKVPHPVANSSSDADFHKAVDHLIKKSNRARFEEGCRAGLQHLDSSELCRQPFLFSGVHGVERAQPHEHVLFERSVIGDVAPRQRFARDVNVGIDHPGCHNESVAAHGLFRGVQRFEVGLLTDVDDFVPANRNSTVTNHITRRIHRDDVASNDEGVDLFGHEVSRLWRGLFAMKLC